MKTAKEILHPFVETPFRHTKIVENDNALTAMELYADQFRSILNKPIAMKDQQPADYERVFFYRLEGRDVKGKGFWEVGYFVPSQSKISDDITHWSPCPQNPNL